MNKKVADFSAAFFVCVQPTDYLLKGIDFFPVGENFFSNWEKNILLFPFCFWADGRLGFEKSDWSFSSRFFRQNIALPNEKCYFC